MGLSFCHDVGSHDVSSLDSALLRVVKCFVVRVSVGDLLYGSLAWKEELLSLL